MESIFRREDWILYLGDNFYPDGVKSVNDPEWRDNWESMIKPLLHRYGSINTRAILGNHDYHQDPFAQIAFSFRHSSWSTPFFYYDVRINEDVHLIMIDTCMFAQQYTAQLLKTCGRSDEFLNEYNSEYGGEMQYRWLESILDKSTARWKIVCGHYPIISHGPHTVSNELDALHRLLNRYNTSLYVSGHDHNMQMHTDKRGMTHLISGAVCLFSPPTRGPCIIPGPGVMYVEYNDRNLYIYTINAHTLEHSLIKIM